jgi:hypothetical protein
MRGPEIIEVGSDILFISMRFLIVLVNALKLKKKKNEANEEFLLGTNTGLENDVQAQREHFENIKSFHRAHKKITIFHFHWDEQRNLTID